MQVEMRCRAASDGVLIRYRTIIYNSRKASFDDSILGLTEYKSLTHTVPSCYIHYQDEEDIYTHTHVKHMSRIIKSPMKALITNKCIVTIELPLFW